MTFVRFAGVTIDDAAQWTASYFNTTDVALAKNTTNNPPFYIAETGWPTVSSRLSNSAV
jgi:exo-beta-1,3-glucanase (GH17 family)